MKTKFFVWLRVITGLSIILGSLIGPGLANAVTGGWKALAWDCYSLNITGQEGSQIWYDWSIKFSEGETAELLFGNGDSRSIDTEKGNDSYTYSAPGSYDLELKVWNQDKTDFKSCTKHVDVVEPTTVPPTDIPVPPTATEVSNNPPFCWVIPSSQKGQVVPYTATFDATESNDMDGEIVHYQWTWGDGTGDSGGANETHPYNAVGTYYGNLTVSDDDGATSYCTFEVTVELPATETQELPSLTPTSGIGGETETPTPTPDYQPPTCELDEGDDYQTGQPPFTANWHVNVSSPNPGGEEHWQYYWTVSQNHSAVEGGADHQWTYNDAGTYYGNVVVVDNVNQTTYCTFTVVVENPTPVPPSLTPTSGIGGETETPTPTPDYQPPTCELDEGDDYQTGQPPFTANWHVNVSSPNPGGEEHWQYYWTSYQGADPDEDDASYEWTYEEAGVYYGNVVVVDAVNQNTYCPFTVVVSNPTATLTPTSGTGGETETPTPTNTAEPENQLPVCKLADGDEDQSGNAPFEAAWDVSESYDPDGTIDHYYWTPYKDADVVEDNAQYEWTYNDPGSYFGNVVVVDNDGATDYCNFEVAVQTLATETPTLTPTSGIGGETETPTPTLTLEPTATDMPPDPGYPRSCEDVGWESVSSEPDWIEVIKKGESFDKSFSRPSNANAALVNAGWQWFEGNPGPTQFNEEHDVTTPFGTIHVPDYGDADTNDLTIWAGFNYGEFSGGSLPVNTVFSGDNSSMGSHISHVIVEWCHVEEVIPSSTPTGTLTPTLGPTSTFTNTPTNGPSATATRTPTPTSGIGGDETPTSTQKPNPGATATAKPAPLTGSAPTIPMGPNWILLGLGFVVLAWGVKDLRPKAKIT